MKSYLFDANSHSRFTRLSSDHNPIHIDPLATRRMQPGAPIIHGIHALLRLLEEYARGKSGSGKFEHLVVRFSKPIYIGECAHFDFNERSPNTLQARILVGGTETVIVHLERVKRFEQAPFDWSIASNRRVELPTSPTKFDMTEVPLPSGSIEFASIVAHTERMFPSAARHFGPHRLAALVRASSLVGMVVPGLQSLFTGLRVSFSPDVEPPGDHLQFIVASTDSRFRLIDIGVRGGGLFGKLETVSRPPPIIQAAMNSVAPLVGSDEFRGHTALIVGGSRGLGELTAKLVAAGSGRVTITYAAGQEDAEAVCREIKISGGDCEAFAYDVRLPTSEQLTTLLTHTPSHIYYFATPIIFARRQMIFDADRFAEFNAFYVNGFVNLIRSCARLRHTGLTAFYPSSIAVETRPPDMTEYAMSKCAGEILCADLQRNLPGVRIVIRRLPRLLTDQTNTIVKTDSPSPLEVLLPIVREMHSSPIPG